MTTTNPRYRYPSIYKVLEQDYDHERPDVLRSRMFVKAYRTYIKKKLKGTGLTLLPYRSTPYCECTGFITDGEGNFVYFASGDYRWNLHGYGDEWNRRVLIREARDDKDFHGGTNYYCELCDIAIKAQEIIARTKRVKAMV